MNTKRIVYIVIICLLFAAIAIATYIFSTNKHEDAVKEIIKYSKQNSEFKLSNVLEFNWDIAYIDYEHYGNGEKIKEKYHLSCELNTLAADYLYRLIFFQNGKLVKEVICNINEITIDPNIDMIKPDTVFIAEWKQDTTSSSTLYLTKKTS